MRRRSLWPREHGAYFQLMLPLAAACADVTPTLPMLGLTVGACLLFLANEPLRVWHGLRGARMQEQDGGRARTRFLVLALPGAAAAAAGGALASPATWTACSLVAASAVVVGLLTWRRVVHTLWGELAAAIALTGASAPVLVAGGVPLRAALLAWLGWVIGFGGTVVAVRRVIERHQAAASWADLGLAAALVAAGVLAWFVAPFALPLVAVALVLVAVPPRATHLRAVGIAIAVTGLAAIAIQVVS